MTPEDYVGRRVRFLAMVVSDDGYTQVTKEGTITETNGKNFLIEADDGTRHSLFQSQIYLIKEKKHD